MKTQIEQIMKPIRPLNSLLNILWVCVLCILAADLRAETLITSSTISGTFAPSGNPYVFTVNCTVQTGDTLTLEPGVVVWVASNLTITVNGLVQAEGTPSQPITFQAPTSSQYWNTILLNYSGETNVFTYCDFKNASTAVTLSASGTDSAMTAEILNCSFSNCVSQAIYGVAQGMAGGSAAVPGYSYSPTLSATIENCVFNDTSNGCVFNIAGGLVNIFGDVFIGYGYASPTIIANVFQNLSGAAFLMEVGSYAGGGSAMFLNNTIVNCGSGVNATDPWDATWE
jgi:hypothetical protein